MSSIFSIERCREIRHTFDPPSIDVKKILELIAGGESQYLTVKQLGEWRDLIMYAVKVMCYCYEKPGMPKDYPVSVYYRPCWQKIEEAQGDDEKMVDALEDLRHRIKWV